MAEVEPQPADNAKPDDSEPEEKDVPVPPVGKKIGESPDTLRRREEWFRKRSGK